MQWVILFGLLLLSPAESVFADCVARTTAEARNMADEVFLGHIAKVEEKGDQVTVTFETLRLWKGEPGKIRVRTTYRPDPESSSADLFRLPRLGDNWLIYAKAGSFSTTCSRSGPVSQAQEDLRELGQFQTYR